MYKKRIRLLKFNFNISKIKEEPRFWVIDNYFYNNLENFIFKYEIKYWYV
jgi:hypothetical protein